MYCCISSNIDPYYIQTWLDAVRLFRSLSYSCQQSLPPLHLTICQCCFDSCFKVTWINKRYWTLPVSPIAQGLASNAQMIQKGQLLTELAPHCWQVQATHDPQRASVRSYDSVMLQPGLNTTVVWLLESVIFLIRLSPPIKEEIQKLHYCKWICNINHFFITLDKGCKRWKTSATEWSFNM